MLQLLDMELEDVKPYFEEYINEEKEKEKV